MLDVLKGYILTEKSLAACVRKTLEDARVLRIKTRSPLLFLCPPKLMDITL